MEEGEAKTSKYNSGIAIIYRLDALWKDVNNHSRSGQFSQWNADLDRVWCELSRDLSEKDYEDKLNDDGTVKKEGYKSKFDKVDKSVTELGNFDDGIKDSFNKITKDNIIKREKQYKALMGKELFLRRLENKVGKGTAFEDSDGYDF